MTVMHGPGSASRTAVPGATAAFAHTRLSIIDLTKASDQPMFDPAGRVGLAYNGEPYNYLELREELEALGHSFRTTGDTEVGANRLSRMGVRAVQRFVGMWAFRHPGSRAATPLPVSRPLRDQAAYYSVARRPCTSPPRSRRCSRRPTSSSPTMMPYAARSFRIWRLTPRPSRSSAGDTSSSPLTTPRSVSTVRARVSTTRPGLPDRDYQDRAQAAEEFASYFTTPCACMPRADVPVGTCLSGGLDLVDRVRGQPPAQARPGAARSRWLRIRPRGLCDVGACLHGGGGPACRGPHDLRDGARGARSRSSHS